MELCTTADEAHAASVAVDLVLLAAEHHRHSQEAVGLASTPAGGSGGRVTYVGVGWFPAQGGGLGAAVGSAAAGLVGVELQILQALGERQLLLDGHTEEGVQRLLLILRSSQLPLHLIQLSHVLVTAEKQRDA